MPKTLEGFRLSSQQRQLWLSGRAGQRCRAQCAIILCGSLDKRRLKKALVEVVKRNSVLRTTYHRRPGLRLPIQVIAEVGEIFWSEADLTDGDLYQQETRIREYLQQERLTTFDLEEDQPIRSSLLALSANKHLLVTSVLSLSADYLTLKNLVAEISRCYRALHTEEKLPDEPVQYVQFSEWQSELIEGAAATAGREYWQRQDFSAARNLHLPAADQSRRGTKLHPNSIFSLIDPPSLRGVEAILNKYKVSESVFLLACWQVLIRRMTGLSDIVINTCFDGRKHQDLVEVMGLFERWLPVRCYLDGHLRFPEFLRQLNEVMLKASESQEYFEGQVIGDDGSDDPDFPIAFEYQQWPPTYHTPDLSFSVYEQYAWAERFKVKLKCVRREDSLSVEFRYDPACCDEHNITRLAGHFRTLLANVINETDRVILEIEVLTEAEHKELVEQWNDTAAPFPHLSCVQDLFEEQVEYTPDNIAVVYEADQLSYAELNAKANQLAGYLRELGVGPEVRVGLLMERSIELVVALLSVLKAGGAYVPLDPEYPTERLSFIVEDAEIAVLLTHQRLAQTLSIQNCAIVNVDTQWELMQQQSEANPPRSARPDNLVYILYTSGSTGKPKGVMITQQGLVNYLSWCAKTYAVAEGRGAPVHSPIGFDLTVTSLFSPLLAGQRVVLVAEAQGAMGLGSVLRKEGGFSLVKLTPSHLEVLSQLLRNDEAAGRTRALVIGGEALWAESLSFWRANAGGTRIFNEYGPTETVVGCCVYEYADGDSISGRVPIGTPIANMQVYVLDENLQPAPIGVTGELHIGGVGVARGYANQPALTAEKFVPNPFSRKAGARLYRTGDLTRYLPNGNVEFLGRRDDQVKIRGYRIELGEIEEVLQLHPRVRETIVLASENDRGEKHLVAYLVGDPDAVPGISELRQYLKEKLPEYMVPAAWVILERLPLTPNGKIDHRALPEPGRLRADSWSPYAPPQTDLESVIQTLWQEALQVEKVGVNDNFFDLGGHSFHILEINKKLQEFFDNELSLVDMFQYPTINSLAKYLSQEQGPQTSLQHDHALAGARRNSIERRREQRAHNRATKKYQET
jgi:amino acid adenylation domain-containing protein